VADIASHLLGVQGYDTENQRWLRYEPGASAYLNALTELTPGQGYWINVSEGCTWIVTY